MYLSHNKTYNNLPDVPSAFWALDWYTLLPAKSPVAPETNKRNHMIYIFDMHVQCLTNI